MRLDRGSVASVSLNRRVAVRRRQVRGVRALRAGWKYRGGLKAKRWPWKRDPKAHVMHHLWRPALVH